MWPLVHSGQREPSSAIPGGHCRVQAQPAGRGCPDQPHPTFLDAEGLGQRGQVQARGPPGGWCPLALSPIINDAAVGVTVHDFASLICPTLKYSLRALGLPCSPQASTAGPGQA